MINICLVGCVSAGKSTILNAFFGTDFAQCKIKRTTMLPNVFIESDPSITNIDLSDAINKKIKDVNDQIIKQTEKGQKLKLEDYGTELKFNVDLMNMNTDNKKIKICVYDIPGLNDARTKETYRDYLEKNFHKFNIILFVVDIQSGLNTSDEMEIVKFLAKNIHKHQNELEKKKKISMLTVVNKADDMIFNPNNNELSIEGELREMFDQTKITIKDVFQEEGIATSSLQCIPICANSAHLYRMIKKNKDVNKLTKEQIIKIGVNEMGTKFRTKDLDEQKEIVKEKINDLEFVDEQIKLSGFAGIENFLKDFIEINGSNMVIENINLLLINSPKINLDNFIPTLQTRLDIITKIEKYDKTRFLTEFKNMIKQINTLIYKKIQPMIDVDSIIIYYEHIVSMIDKNLNIKNILLLHWPYHKKPEYLIDKILDIMATHYSDKVIDIKDLVYFDTIEIKIEQLKGEVIDLLLESILSNPREQNTFNFKNWNISEGIKNIINIFEKIKNSTIFIEFLRFFLINYYSQVLKIDELIIKKMLLKEYGEIPITTFLEIFINNKDNKSINIKTFYKDIHSNNKNHLLELYYITKCKELKESGIFINSNKLIPIDFGAI